MFELRYGLLEDGEWKSVGRDIICSGIHDELQETG